MEGSQWVNDTETEAAGGEMLGVKTIRVAYLNLPKLSCCLQVP